MNPSTPLAVDPSLGLELAALMEHRGELLLVVGEDGCLSWMGPAARRWFGRSVVGRPLVELVHPAEAGRLRVALAQVTRSAAPVAEVRCRLVHHSGEWRRLELSLTDRRGRAGGAGVAGVVCVARDAAASAALTARILHQATHDALTALPNRASLLDRLHEPPGRRAESIAVLYVDLDRFKNVNDSLGHTAGDRVLVVVAERLRQAVRPGDTVARLGGDEFVVVAGGVSDGPAALEIAKRIASTICRPIAIDGRTVGVGASVGVSVGSCERSMELLDEADRAMYQAKRAGRTGCALYGEGLAGAEDGRPDR